MGRTTKEWYFFNVSSYDFVNDSLSSWLGFFTLRRRAVAVKARPLSSSATVQEIMGESRWRVGNGTS
jgi:hypothetical protein